MRISFILCFLILAGCGPSAQGPVEQQIHAVMQDAVSDGFSGSILVLRNETAIYQRSFGLADREKNVPISSDTKFPVASLSKAFTATLVIGLIEKKLLRIDSRVDEIFSGIKGAPIGSATVGQLLSHTSGVGEELEGKLPNALSVLDLRDIQISSPPGSHSYSNTGYVILKLIAESVGRASYEELLKQNIFVPAQMNDSGVVRTNIPPDLALSYENANSTLPVANNIPFEVLDGPGSIFSTVADLRRFDTALRDHVLLNPESVSLMNLDQTGTDEWSLGWALDEQGGSYYPWHRGDYKGFHALYVRQIHSNERVFILSNSDQSDIGALKTSLMRILRRTR